MFVYSKMHHLYNSLSGYPAGYRKKGRVSGKGLTKNTFLDIFSEEKSVMICAHPFLSYSFCFLTDIVSGATTLPGFSCDFPIKSSFSFCSLSLDWSVTSPCFPVNSGRAFLDFRVSLQGRPRSSSSKKKSMSHPFPFWYGSGSRFARLLSVDPT